MSQPQRYKGTTDNAGLNYEISTLGSFHVLCNQHDLTDTLNKSAKIWNLFKYLLTFRDDLILAEKIVESLWPDADYVDPKRTLRAQVFRLRQSLTSSVDNCPSQGGLIVSSRGCYKFETKECCNIDVVAYENLFRTAYDSVKEDPSKAIELFQEVVSMYKGDYLSETDGYG